MGSAARAEARPAGEGGRTLPPGARIGEVPTRFDEASAKGETLEARPSNGPVHDVVAPLIRSTSDGREQLPTTLLQPSRPARRGDPFGVRASGHPTNAGEQGPGSARLSQKGMRRSSRPSTRPSTCAIPDAPQHDSMPQSARFRMTGGVGRRTLFHHGMPAIAMSCERRRNTDGPRIRWFFNVERAWLDLLQVSLEGVVRGPHTQTPAPCSSQMPEGNPR